MSIQAEDSDGTPEIPGSLFSEYAVTAIATDEYSSTDWGAVQPVGAPDGAATTGSSE